MRTGIARLGGTFLSGRVWILLALVFILLSTFGVFAPIDRGLLKVAFKSSTRMPTNDVVIIEIDSRSLQQLDTWPWPRRLHGELLKAVAPAQPKLIAFDVDFSANSNPVDDAAFSRALKTYPASVILPVFQQTSHDSAGNTVMVSAKPINAFSKHASLGGVNIHPSSSGTIWEYPAADWIDGTVRPSLATWLAENSTHSTKNMLIDFGIDATKIPHISYVDVLKNRIPLASFKNKRILVGATSVELGDRFATPRNGILPGVVIQALAAESMLQNRLLQETGPVVSVLGLLVLFTTFFHSGKKSQPKKRLIISGSVMVSALALPFVTYMLTAIWIDSAAWMLAGGTAFILMLIENIRVRIAENALHDTETGLPNRRKLELDLESIENNYSIIQVCAINNFSQVESAFSRKIVVQMIMAAAGRFAAVNKADAVYNLSGGLMACVVPSDVDHIAELPLRSTKAFEKPITLDGHAIDLAISIGLTKTDRTGPSSAIESAIMAAGQARDSQQLIAWFNQEDLATTQDQLSLLSDLRTDLADEILTLVYQPKFDTKKKRITKVEALLRWHHKTRGVVSPDQFIKVAEASNTIHELTRFVLQRALQDCANWKKAGLHLGIAVNVSAANIIQKNFVADVKNALKLYAVSPSDLTLEITETAIMKHPHLVYAALNALRAHGVLLSIDDYGTGQSSLAYVRSLPVHELKIDKSFVMALSTSPQDAVLVRSTIAMAHELELDVVAEGVEDEESRTLLESYNCDYLQGYFISRPIPYGEFLSLLQQQEINICIAA